MKQICLCLSLLVFQINALVVPNKPHFPVKQLGRISRHLIELIESPIPNVGPEFMAVIIHGDCDHMCGGVFLTHRSILTLANCVKKFSKGQANIKVYPNIPYYLPHCDEDNILYPIAQVHFSPDYKPNSPKEDISSLAIIHLEKPVDKVKTVSLSHDNHSNLKEETFLYNLGIDRRLNVDDFDDLHECEILWPENAPAICGALELQAEPHKCTLVPGLPLIANVNGQSYLKGLLVDPLSCPPKDVIYVNVTSDLPWILTVNSNSDHNSNNGTFVMRQVQHPPFSPDTHVLKSLPFVHTEHHHTHNTDNSENNMSVQQIVQGCNCNCGSHRSNNPLNDVDEDTFIDERSNNNNNNNNVKGNVQNTNQNNNGN